MSATPTLLDPDEVLARPEFEKFELIDGVPRAKDAGPAPAPTGRPLDPDEMLLYPEFDRSELIDGIPVEKAVSNRSEAVATELVVRLSNHCKAHQLGRVFGSNTGFRCFPHRPKLVRKPDVSVVRAGRFPNDQPPDGWYTLAPDLAVEVHSPTDRAEEVEERVADYRAAGVKLVWLVSTQWRTVLVRRLDGTAAEVGPAGELGGEDVLPGFSCTVADLFV